MYAAVCEGGAAGEDAAEVLEEEGRDLQGGVQLHGSGVGGAEAGVDGASGLLEAVLARPRRQHRHELRGRRAAAEQRLRTEQLVCLTARKCECVEWVGDAVAETRGGGTVRLAMAEGPGSRADSQRCARKPIA